MSNLRRDQCGRVRRGLLAPAGERPLHVAGERRVRTARPSLADERGQSVVEFALVLPLIVILALALFGAGKVLFYWNNATQVANEGARLVVVNAGPTFPEGLTFENYLKRQVWTLGGPDASLVVRVDLEDVPSSSGGVLAAPKPGSAATVYVCRTYKLPFFLPDLKIRGKATMRVERTVTNIAETGTC